MLYTEQTKQGHKIVLMGFYYDEWSIHSRTYFVIFHRETEHLNDYNIALNYNFYDGTWGQGIYDFKSCIEATEWLDKHKKFVEYYKKL